MPYIELIVRRRNINDKIFCRCRKTAACGLLGGLFGVKIWHRDTYMRIIFMGTPQFAVPALRQLVLNGYEVAAVYTRPDKQAGRGRQVAFSPVKQAALEMGLAVEQPPSLRKEEVTAQMASYKPDAIVVAAYGQILPKAVLELPEHGCINIHPSLLPRHRGASPVVAAILAGDEFTGVSIMLMDEGLDTGPVIAQAQIAVMDSDDAASLGARLSQIAAHMLLDVLPDWKRGRMKVRAQDNEAATYIGAIGKEDGEIDWRRTAPENWRRLRAYNPWPGAYTRWRGKTLKILQAQPLPQMEGVSAGQVITLPGGFGIGTGDGVLEVLSVQLEGKRVMPAAEFIRGQRQLIGEVLPS